MPRTPRQPLDVFVIAHTHWDREWYHPEPRFRARLVALVDELLDDADDAPFLLDGQAILLDDYLAVRPGRTDALSRALRNGAIECGPWYVLADLLIPGGEALVRNLLAGRRTVQRLGGHAPDVLYAPDAFGHPAALPTIAAGFGCPLVVLWRGYGGARWPAGDAARWVAPDGSRVLLYHLPPDGYEFGASLPVERRAATDRWATMRAVLAPRATLGVTLLTSGADHHARQPDLRAALSALARAARPDRLRRVSLERAATELVRRAQHSGTRIAEVRGELRDSYGYAWTLQGTLGGRAALKRMNARAERLLGRDTEPWVALGRRGGGQDRRPLMESAWRTLLENHPHDTLCGTVTDEVAEATRHRAGAAVALATELRDAALLDLAGHDVVAARARPGDWRLAILVRNAAARRRSGVAEFTMLLAERAEPVGPGAATLPRGNAGGRGVHVASAGPSASAGVPSTSFIFDLVESPLHYPKNDRVVALPMLAWVADAPGCSVFELASDRAAAPRALVQARARGLANGVLEVRAGASGMQRLVRDGTVVVPRLVAFEAQRDVGDLYTSAPRGRPRTLRGGATAVRAMGGLRGALQSRWSDGDPSGRGAASPSGIVIETTTQLDADAGFVRLRVQGTLQRAETRLRIVVSTGLARPRVVADAAFGPVERVPLRVPAPDRRREAPPPTAPLHRYVSVYGARRGVTIYSDGLAEYEAMPDGRVAITLVRGTGALSYADLPERPGHAAWPVPTPGAQGTGPFEAEFGIFPHGADSDATRALVERTADDVLLPITGVTVRSAIAPLRTSAGVVLEGDGLAMTAIKDAEEGDWTVLRCMNVTARRVAGRWRCGFPVSEARLARLDETPQRALTVAKGTVRFSAAPRAVVTILVR